MNKSLKRLEVPECGQCSSRTYSIFCNLSHQELSEISEVRTHNLYKKGQVIFYEGNQPQGLFCIYSGKVKIHKLGDDGKEQIVRFAKSGDVLGYRSLLSGDNYAASATAIDSTVVCYFPKQVFTSLMEENRDMPLQIIRLLSNDLKIAERKIIHMAQKHVRERMAEALLMLKEFYGVDEERGTINMSLTREDIANIAGTSTETSIRVLSEFNKENVIALIGKKIKIVNLPELIKRANVID